ncbi:hypothetical protein [Pleomorphovibrio marinus]|uniref:hypothetical protein n=1 Tax=Pleomorphovibrio marinus TaxID=2164132 RepID=UPI000E0A6534|nr:hypothetical protein [Pleomorphovibrio marinus]
MATYKFRIVEKLNLDKLGSDNLEYFCISDDIDREVMRRKNKEYNEELAFKTLYFVVTSDKRIAVIPNHIFDPWLKKEGLELPIDPNDKSDLAKEAIDWFIENVHRVYPK